MTAGNNLQSSRIMYCVNLFIIIIFIVIQWDLSYAADSAQTRFVSLIVPTTVAQSHLSHFCLLKVYLVLPRPAPLIKLFTKLVCYSKAMLCLLTTFFCLKKTYRDYEAEENMTCSRKINLNVVLQSIMRSSHSLFIFELKV